MKKIIVLLLVAAMLLPVLAACSEKGEELTIVGESCTLLYDPSFISESAVKDLAKAIKEKTGVEPALISTHSFAAGVLIDEGTIVVGKVNNDICTDVYRALRRKDYVCGIYNARYLIGGPSEEATTGAIRYFCETVLSEAKEGDLTVNTLQNYQATDEYNLERVTLGGVSIGEAAICLPDSPTASESRTALILQSTLQIITGYFLPIEKLSEATATAQIRIGASICEATQLEPHCYKVTVKGTVMEMVGESLYAYEKLQSSFENGVFFSRENVLDFTDGVVHTGSSYAPVYQEHQGEVRLLYNNIWASTEGEYEQRAWMLAELYGEYLPDIIGLQEFSPRMRKIMVPYLESLGYAEVPVDSNNLFYSGEKYTRTPVFYRTETVELLEAGYNCLAHMDYGKYPHLLGHFTSSQVSAAARGDRSKAVTWGIFRVKETGHVFLAGSTHLWWQANAVDDIARVLQMQEMRNLLTAAADAYLAANGIESVMPIYIGGDFNSRTIRDSYHSMGRETPFENINDQLLGEGLRDSTMHAYPVYNEKTGMWEQAGTPQGAYTSALDHIFANKAAHGSYTVNQMKMLYENYAFSSSDHSPIFADITFGNTVPTIPAP